MLVSGDENVVSAQMKYLEHGRKHGAVVLGSFIAVPCSIQPYGGRGFLSTRDV